MDGLFTKHFLGAYKYAMTQTFAIPTIDDAEKDKLNGNVEESEKPELEENTQEGTLNEENIEKMLGEPSIDDYDNIFNLGQSA